MSPETLKEVMTRVDALAAKLGVAAEALLAWATRQVYVEGWLTLTQDAIFLVTGGILYWLGEWAMAESPRYQDYDGPTPKCFIRIGGLILLLLGFVYTVATSEYVFRMFNPEYNAVAKILYLLKP